MNPFQTILSPLRRSAFAGLVLIPALSVALSACDSPTDVAGTVYTLATVNEQALPAPFPDPYLPPETFEVTSGTLTLRPDGTFSQALVMRCRTPQPSGGECEVHGDGRVTTEGSYSRTAGSVSFDDRQFPATFEPALVKIDLGFPASHGAFMPRFVLEYRR
jgi:hypothetical protein